MDNGQRDVQWSSEMALPVIVNCVQTWSWSSVEGQSGSHDLSLKIRRTFEKFMTKMHAWYIPDFYWCFKVNSLFLSVHHYYKFFTLSPCAVESHPTPGDSRGSSSPSRSISGVSSHVANRGSDRIPLECVHPSLPWSSYLSRSIHSSEHHVIFHPSCSHHVSKVA